MSTKDESPPTRQNELKPWTTGGAHPLAGGLYRRIFCGNDHIGTAVNYVDARRICDAHNATLERKQEKEELRQALEERDAWKRKFHREYTRYLETLKELRRLQALNIDSIPTPGEPWSRSEKVDLGLPEASDAHGEHVLQKALLAAACSMDWQQVVLNGGPPCFHLCEDGHFCGRAKSWQGHDESDDETLHAFISLERLLSENLGSSRAEGVSSKEKDLGLPEADVSAGDATRQKEQPMEPDFDSGPETKAHIRRVNELLELPINSLIERAHVHDDSKLLQPEKELFDRVTGKLKGMTYGSDEYKASLAELGPALKHHYAHNTHHPEHYENGIDGMSLLDLIEMLCDWKAAGERHADGSIMRSLTVNQNRFKIGPQLQNILINSAVEAGWMERCENCGEPTSRFDTDAVPLCGECITLPDLPAKASEADSVGHGNAVLPRTDSPQTIPVVPSS